MLPVNPRDQSFHHTALLFQRVDARQVQFDDAPSYDHSGIIAQMNDEYTTAAAGRLAEAGGENGVSQAGADRAKSL
ncbi:MAG: hypothetical protein Kow00124_06500 [Anaerolineae bacterium]